jgi:hypothetical protein
MPEKGANALYTGQCTISLLHSPSKQVMEVSTLILTKGTDRKMQIGIEAQDKFQTNLT